MSTLIYGPQAFTVGSDQNLDVFDSNWVDVIPASDELRVAAATDDVRLPVSGTSSALSRFASPTVLDQKIVADIGTGSGAFAGLQVRTDADGNGYLVEWDGGANDVVLYRVTGRVAGGGGTFTVIASGGSVAASTTYLNGYLKATGINPVVLEAGDDTNGAAIVTFNDSNAARHQSGQPCLSMAGSDTGWLDNVEIWNEEITITRKGRRVFQFG